MPMPRKGDRVRYTAGRESLEGRVAKVKGDVVFLKVTEPVHFLDTPDTIVPGEIMGDMALANTAALGYGPAQALEDQGIPLPAGRWSADSRIYHLRKPMPVRKIMEFCKKFYPDEAICWHQAITMTTVPVDARRGTFEELD